MTLWAKHDEKTQRFHLLIHHLADVAAVTEALLALPVIRQRLARLAGRNDFDAPACAGLCVLAALHDAGKFNCGFQRRVRGKANQEGHVGTVLALLKNPGVLQNRFLQAIGFDMLIAWCNDDCMAAAGLLIASLSHHGHPQRASSEVRKSVWQECDGIDPLAEMENFFRSVRGWYPAAFAGEASLPSSPEFQHAFNGLVTLADWIASDNRFFPYEDQPDESRIEKSRVGAKKALSIIGLDSSAAWSLIRAEFPSFQRTFGYAFPRPLQKIVEEIPIPQGPSIAILEAETGSGKTEAAFRYFLRLAAAGRADGMYFALPTRSAAVQIHSRIKGWVKNAFGEKAPPVVLAVPGYLKVDDIEGTRRGFEVLWPPDEEARRICRGWAAENPKRYMAATVIVGTIDQALLSALQASHADMRYAALLRHLLVVDEVHASDVYMRRILEYLLYWHCRAGADALLLSATLGAEFRKTCLFPRENQDRETDPGADKPYPLFSRRILGSQTVEEYPIDHSANCRIVQIETAEITDDTAGIAARAVAAARRGARVLVIRNLVDDAIRTQQAVEAEADTKSDILFRCRDVAAPHHGRFAPDDRKALDRAVEEAFGKESAHRGIVLVATQTVEQSLDIDADYMITDLAPMDVLLQRLGRLHRHDRDRPDGFATPRVCVMAPGEGVLQSLMDKRKCPHGWGNVYEDLGCLEVTRRLISEKREIKIPEMNRELIERVLRWEGLDQSVWLEHKMNCNGKRLARRNEAGFSVVRRDIPFTETESEFSLDSVSSTRLGVNDRLINLPESVVGPFGLPVQTIRVPGWMIPESGVDLKKAGVDLKITDISINQGEITFSCQGRSFFYNRYGLQRSGQDA